MLEADYETIRFYQDSKGNYVGSFYVRSLVDQNSDGIVAYWVYTSSALEYEICPQQGFLAPGESIQIGVLWPDESEDG